MSINLSLLQNNNAKTIYTRLKGYGYTDISIAAVLGSIYSESSFLPTAVQSIKDDASYIKDLDKGIKSEKSFCLDSHGFGLCQWTYRTRKSGLYRFIKNKIGTDFSNLLMQVDFINFELTNSVPCYDWVNNRETSYSDFKKLGEKLKDPANTDLKQISREFMLKYEAPANQTEENINKRYENSLWCLQNIINSTNNEASGSPSYSTSIISIALNEVGKHEKKGKDGKYHNVIPYNEWWYKGSNYGDGAEWCAVFVSWCLNQAGLSDLKTAAGCGSFWNMYKDDPTLGQRDNTQLQPSDVIFFLNDKDKIASHVGLVYQRTDKGYITIEGNTSYNNGLSGNVEGMSSDYNLPIWVSKKNRPISGGYYKIIGGIKTSTLLTPEIATEVINEVDDRLKQQFDSIGNNLYNVLLSKTPDNYQRYTTEQRQEQFWNNIPPRSVKRYQTTVNKERENYLSSLKGVDVSNIDNRLAAQGLLVSPTFVESPFIILKVGNHTFGSYHKSKGSHSSRRVNVTYPNFMQSIDIVKINGQVNQYTINMVYQIQAGEDPNLIDKILSSVGYGKIKISYGDWNAPTFIYKEEEALITKVNTKVDFSSSRILYSISCVGTAMSALSGNMYFSAKTAKPSNEIKNIIFNNTGNILDAFPGMKKNWDKLISNGIIRTDDAEVELVAKNGMSSLSYLNYLVSCMTENGDRSTGLRSANYYLTICDDVYNEYGGTYFKITKVKTKANQVALESSDTYEVNIGYPDNNLVVKFDISTDNSWSLFYKYSENITIPNYVYDIDNVTKKITEVSAPNTLLSNKYYKVTEAQRDWWTKMTQFPITATLTVKGLLRPLMLMTYIRINAMFYGQRHISSGLYIVTKQQDRVDSSGYRTTLSLQKITGDDVVLVS